jgi:hypothetical protein
VLTLGRQQAIAQYRFENAAVEPGLGKDGGVFQKNLLCQGWLGDPGDEGPGAAIGDDRLLEDGRVATSAADYARSATATQTGAEPAPKGARQGGRGELKDQ